jgi:putative mRNA 3-end processing factor
MSAIDATGAERVLVTHGYRDAVVRALRERGLQAESLTSRWEGESGESEAEVEEDVVPDDESVPE